MKHANLANLSTLHFVEHDTLTKPLNFEGSGRNTTLWLRHTPVNKAAFAIPQPQPCLPIAMNITIPGEIKQPFRIKNLSGLSIIIPFQAIGETSAPTTFGPKGIGSCPAHRLHWSIYKRYEFSYP